MQYVFSDIQSLNKKCGLALIMLICTRTFTFLHFAGAGYHMVLVKERNCDVRVLHETIQCHVPEARLESNVGAELSYLLPFHCKPQFHSLFTEIERRKAELCVSSYGASVTTMEEVFLR